MISASYAGSDYPCYIWSGNAEVSVTLNGFPIYEDPSSGNPGGVSADVLPYLKDGANVFAYSFSPTEPGTDEQTPNLSIRLQEREQSEHAYEPILLYDDLWAAGPREGLLGGYSSTEHLGTFVSDGAGGYVWEFQWPSDHDDYPIYDYLPCRLAYNVSEQIDVLGITFSDEEDTQAVVYVVDLDTNVGIIDISSLTPSSGAQFVENSGFSKVKFAYTEPDAAAFLGFVFYGEDVSDVSGFPIVFPPAPFPINSGTMDGGTQIYGDVDFGKLTSEAVDQDDIWEYSFATTNAFHYVPTCVKYMSESAVTVTLVFSDGATTTETYADIELVAGAGTIDLTTETASPGTRLGDNSFKQIKVIGDSPFSIGLILRFDMRSVSGTFEFALNLPQEWAWETAQTVQSLSQNDKDDIIAELLVLDQQHTPVGGLWYEMNTEDVDAVIDRFTYRIADIASASGASVASIEARQADALEELFDMTSANDALELIDVDDDGDIEEHLVFTIFSNGKVVEVTHTSLSAPIITKDFVWPAGTFTGDPNNPLSAEERTDQFAISVWFSKVDTGGQTYEWKIVR